MASNGTTPRIVSLGTAVPPHRLTQDACKAIALRLFRKGMREAERLMPVFSNVQVDQRFLCVPEEWFDREHSFDETNRKYIEWAERLSCSAVQACLDQAGLAPRDVDHLVFVSTSGMSTPSIDARMINRMGFRGQIKRTPIFGLGCAGGAAGLSRACDMARADPGQRILLVAVELSSLTFQFRDFSKSNLVAASLFSDGAAAVLVEEGPTRGNGAGPRVLATRSTLWPDTLDVMGWDFTQTGLRVIFSREIPQIIADYIRGNVEEFLASRDMSMADLSHFVLHPGGAKVLSSFQRTMELEEGQLEHSRWILQHYGNMSSPTLLFILERYCRQTPPQPGEYGLCTAFGPGFSAELLLMRW